MSFLLAGIIASTAVSAYGTDKANKADRATAELETFSDLLDIEQLKSDTAIQEYNMRTDLASLESEQVAVASAMGKRSSGEGFQRMQEVAREDMEKNIVRGKEQVTRAEKFGKVSASARESATKSRATTRNIGTFTSGLLSFSKALA